MERNKTYSYLVIVAIIITLAISYFDIRNQQIKFHRKYLIKQLEIVNQEIESEGNRLLNDLNSLLYSADIHNVFDPKSQFTIISKLQIIYSKYNYLITNIAVYDNKANVFSLYKDNNDNYITDQYQLQWQKQLYFKEILVKEKDESVYYFVEFDKTNNVLCNIAISVDFTSYVNSKLNALFFEKILTGHVINLSAQNETVNPGETYIDSTLILQMKSGKNGLLDKTIPYKDDNQKVTLLYLPVHILNNNLGIVFSIQKTDFEKIFNRTMLIYTLIIATFIVLLLVILYYQYRLVNKQREEYLESLESFRNIMEKMPIGIIILNSMRQIELINKAAKSMLFINEDENLVGFDISNRFFLGRSLVISNDNLPVFDSNHFYQYEKDGNEVFIYKKDIPIKLGNKEIIVQSFLDVTMLERSRKREIAANMAKSEFLARMSHEIRTPMNGIIGMADAINTTNFTTEQIEQFSIMRKSADMLLSIINDILDFSKIEAGKMLIDEVPFKLRDEIMLAIELFKPLAQEKGVEIHAEYQPDVLNNLIGDPFRLRQILNNLLGNAVKFTHKGKIVISVERVEEYNRNVQLRFSVKDTGIGIAKDKLASIFNSFTQADHSTTRKYGGTGLGTTITKQLVELMNGEITVNSPSGISDDPTSPGTIFTFTLEFYSNEPLEKDIDNDQIKSFKDIKIFIIGEAKSEERNIEEILSYFGIQVDQQVFSKSIVDYLIKNSKSVSDVKYNLIIVKDSSQFDGFKVLNKLQEAQLTDKYNIVLASSNDRVGNYAKSKKLGVDHYLILPFESSVLYNIISETFTEIDYTSETQKPSFAQIRKDLKILVAEDNQINQKVARTIFKNIGYEVEFAKDGSEAIEMVKEKPYDIIFMDIMMPVMDGYQATIELRAKGYEFPIIAMTANANKEDKQNAISIGMSDYIVKPVKIDSVKKILIKYFS